MSWRHQMILYRSELVGLVTYIYKIVPHTRGFYSRVCVYVARGARVFVCVRLDFRAHLGRPLGAGLLGTWRWGLGWVS